MPRTPSRNRKLKSENDDAFVLGSRPTTDSDPSSMFDDDVYEDDQPLSSPTMPCHQYKLTVAYNGYRFSGFQTQSSQQVRRKQPPKRPHWDSSSGRQKRVAHTVQDVLEHGILGFIQYQLKQLKEQQQQQEDHNDALDDDKEKKMKQEKEEEESSFLFSRDDLKLICAGRTDKGVHALGQVVSFFMPRHIVVSCLDILQGINSRLPEDASISSVEGPLFQRFHPRLDAVQKQYSYTLRFHRALINDISDGRGINAMRNALLDPPCLWLVPWHLDDAIFPVLCQALSGTHDFTQFIHRETRDKYDNHIMSVQLEYKEISCHSTPFGGGEIVNAQFVATSKGFRRTQVRNLVGFCVRLARRPQPEIKNGENTTTTMNKQSQIMDIIPSGVNGTWECHVAPYFDLVEAAPASGLCLDHILYSDDTKQKRAIEV